MLLSTPEDWRNTSVLATTRKRYRPGAKIALLRKHARKGKEDIITPLRPPKNKNKTWNITYWPSYDYRSKQNHPTSPLLVLTAPPALSAHIAQRQKKQLQSSFDGLAKGIASHHFWLKRPIFQLWKLHAGLQVLTHRLAAVISLQCCFSSSDTRGVVSKISLKFNRIWHP